MREPIVAGPQGVPFADRWDALSPPPDPNDPQYDLGNTYKRVPPGTRAFPPPWGGGGAITRGAPMTQDPMATALHGRPDRTMSALFAHPPQHLQRMAGDVVSGPWGNPPRVPSINMGGVEGMLDMTGNVDTLGVVPHPSAVTPGNMGRVMDMLYPLGKYSK